LKKDGPTFELNAFGVTLGVFNSFESLYKFAMVSKNTGTIMAENVQA
jgi:hypothetical protein